MVTVTKYVWDPVFDCVTHELDENNVVKAEYHNEPQQYGGVLSQRRGTTSHYHHHDALGSTRFLTDSSSNVTDTYLHDAWGSLVAQTGTTVNPFKWVGKCGYYTDDSTSQVYVRARAYQPTVARWVSVDPMPILQTDPNVFRYVRNSPNRSFDPSGMVEPCTVIIVGGIIILGLCGCGQSKPPVPTMCQDGTPIPNPPLAPNASNLPPWAQTPVECDPKGVKDPNLFAQTGCGKSGPVLRICSQGFPERLPKRTCITACLVQKEQYALQMLNCCVKWPCTSGKSPGNTEECTRALDCFTFSTLGPCLETCLKTPPPYHRDNPDDRDHEVVKRLRALVEKTPGRCAGQPHPCDVCN